MSAVVAAVDTNAEKPVSRRSRGKRAPGSRRRGGRKPAGEKTEGSGEASAPREKKPRPESVPVPATLIGQTKTGVVSAVIKKGRVKFGFIHLGNGPEIDESAPRIYFSFDQLADSTVPVRRGYIVSFKISADESQRPFADNVALTEEGKAIAAAREADIAQRKSEKPAVEESEKPKRAPRERRVVEDKLVALKVTCEGKTEAKVITFNFAQSVGKLKNIATTTFEAPVEYNVFHVAANGEKVFLTKAILVTLSENDTIHLAAPPATA